MAEGWAGGVSTEGAGSLSSGGRGLGAGGSGPQHSGEVERGEEGGDGMVGAPRSTGERAEGCCCGCEELLLPQGGPLRGLLAPAMLAIELFLLP